LFKPTHSFIHVATTHQDHLFLKTYISYVITMINGENAVVK